MNCFRCRQGNPPQAKYCFECGAPLQLLSPPGGMVRAASDASEGERKRVTVMFADLEDSMSLLAGRDPEEARLLLDGVLVRMMEAVHSYEGTVNQILGDGIMALFGAPIAHEDHALRACYAALRLQDSINRFAAEMKAAWGTTLRVRVGLNAGEVLVRSIAGGARRDYTAIGETTHLAAKVEQMAEPGKIYATRNLVRLVEGYVRATPLGSRPVKGLAEPVALYEIAGTGPLRTRFQVSARRGLSRFVGRQAETGALAHSASLALAGSGRVAAVVGEPGVGKSRLLWEFTQARRLEGWSVYKASTSSHGDAVSYLPVTELLARYFDIDPADERALIDSKIRRRLAALDPALDAHLAPLCALFDVTVASERWDALDPPQRHRRTLEAVTALFVRESRANPLIIVVEDLHTVDAETQQVLDALAAALKSERLMLMVEHRPEYRHDWPSEDGTVRVDVAPLPADSVGVLFRSLVGDDPALAPLERLVLERTEGNPFFIEESLRSLVDTGVLRLESGSYRLTRPVTALDIPASVQDILAARVDRLPEQDKTLLQLASVVGREVSSEVLARVAGLEDLALKASLARLVSAEFIAETSPFPHPAYAFKHAFTHQVAYSSLLQSRRKVLHGRIREAIESLYAERLSEHVESLAHHAVRAEQWPGALRYLRQAALRATERAANLDALRHLEEAIRIVSLLPKDTSSLEQAIDLRLDLRNPLVARGAFARILPVLKEAAALAEELGDEARRARVTAYIAGYFWLAGQHEAAVQAGERALGNAATAADLGTLVTTRFYVGASRHSMAQYRQGMEILASNIAALEGAGRNERFSMAGLPAVLSRSIRAWSQSELGDFDPATSEATEALKIAEAAGHAFSTLTASFVLAVVHLARGDLKQAIRILEGGLAHSRAERMRIWYPAFAVLLAQALALAGRAQTAAPMVQKALPVPTDAIYFAPFAVVAASEVYLLAGQVGEAARFGERALELARRKGERGYEAWTLRVLGDIAAAQAPPDTPLAGKYYGEALALGEALEMRPLAARCHLGLGLLHAKAGEHEKAAASLERARKAFEDIGMPFWATRARAAMAQR